LFSSPWGARCGSGRCSCSALGSAAWSPSSPGSAVGVLLTALLIPPLLARMRAEERLLHTHFGDEYDAYRCRTSRLIPGIY
jgi:protein-S-isoprenylcysteine O-methyltransferase Ste14